MHQQAGPKWHRQSSRLFPGSFHNNKKSKAKTQAEFGRIIGLSQLCPSSSEKKMSSNSSSSKPRNVEASLSDALPNNSSRTLIFLLALFRPRRPANASTPDRQQQKQDNSVRASPPLPQRL